MPATAVLDILSGLPNPQWVLTPDVAKQICDFILSAQPLKDVQPEAIPGLGYRGLLVDLPDCQAVDSTLRVFNGLVEIGGTFFRDSDHHIERLLLESAGETVDDTLIEHARKALE
ncbi:hypothetical protein [uncultured Roseibium sp.]|uniref:hypothetical protein n=1 Tax=uncultured Roseibium sp. TaxID=1936171 RepID=UPI00374D6562